MSKSDKTCLLFTQTFPYGENEVFVERELTYLAKYFKKVIIFPMQTGNCMNCSLPENTIVYELNKYFLDEKDKLKFLLLNLSNIIKLLYLEFTSHPFSTIKFFRRILSDITDQIKKANIIRAQFPEIGSKDQVLYSFWFDRWITVLGLAIEDKYKTRIISRAHAFDLYEEDNVGGYILYRKFQFNCIDKVYTVSKHGEEYLKRKYPNYQNKIGASYLGTIPHNHLNPFDAEGSHFILVSCGSVQHRKRIIFFPELLEALPAKYKWVHFGDGPEMAELQEKIKRKGLNERILLKGHLRNEDFLLFLRSTSVSLFVSLSSNEGVPYSMMEAISFGIPLISTDVGGCSEICTKETGVMIPKDFEINKVAEIIIEFMNSSMNTPEFREGVFRFWDNNFNANKNYFSFYNEISKY